MPNYSGIMIAGNVNRLTWVPPIHSWGKLCSRKNEQWRDDTVAVLPASIVRVDGAYVNKRSTGFDKESFYGGM